MSVLASPILAFLLITSAVERIHSQAVDPSNVLSTLQEEVLSKGPHGEEPTPASSVSLTAEEIDKIRALKAKAAIVMHRSGITRAEALSQLRVEPRLRKLLGRR